MLLWLAFGAALLFFVVQMRILPGTSARAGQRFGPPPLKGFQILQAVMERIRDDYIEARDPVLTAEGAYRGMLNSLDPLSAYLDRGLTAKYLAGGKAGKAPGIIVMKRGGTFPLVVAVVAGSPAEKAGLARGDVLTSLDKQNTLEMSLTEVNLLLRGADESPVALRVLRAGDALEFTVARAVVFPQAHEFAPDSGGAAILRIHEFRPGLAADVAKTVVPAVKAGKKPLVLDLRDAAEGDFEEARAVANLFVKTDAAGAFEKKGGVKTPVALGGAAELAGIPVVVWTDQATMGAAEFVAGVLQEIGKAKVAGFPTPGLVGKREMISLKDETAILLTTEVFSLPSGKPLWGKGIAPDAAIDAKDPSEKAFLAATLPLFPKR